MYIIAKVTYMFSLQSFPQQSHLCLWNKENCLTWIRYYLLLVHRLYKVLCKSSKKDWTISAQLWKTCLRKPLQKSAKDIDQRWRWCLAAGRNHLHSWWNTARNLRSLCPNSSDSRLTKLFQPQFLCGGCWLLQLAQDAFIHVKDVTPKWNIKGVHKMFTWFW